MMKLIGPAWIENDLEKKAGQMIPAKRQKYPGLTPQKGPEDIDTINILPVTIGLFQLVERKPSTWHAKTEKEVRSLTTWNH